jgi:FkbM family methyltransferase
MKQVAGVFVPSAEADMTKYLQASGGVYQNTQLLRSLEFVSCWDLAIDVGAHVGTWSKVLVQKFNRVVAFEPMSPLRACLEKNVVSDRLQIVPMALGNRHGAVSFSYDESHTGATHIAAGQPGIIPLGKLDDFAFDNVGYIKLDCEGFEQDVLEGAQQTLDRCKPIIIVEEKFHGQKHYGKQPYAAVAVAEALGAKLLDRVGDDLILGWPQVPGKVAAARATPPDHHLAMAQALQQNQDVAGARLLYRKLQMEHPRVPELANQLALCEFQLANFDGALEYAARACQLNMNEARYKNTLATCLWVVGRTEEAVAAVEAALRDNPQLPEAKQNLVQMQSERIRAEASAASYAEALALHPNSPQLLIKLGMLHAQHGSLEQAQLLFERAVQLEPENTEARRALDAIQRRSAA